MSTVRLHTRNSGQTAVLVVEDEPVLLHLTATTLRERGYQVSEAVNAVQAAEILRTSPTINVAFVDVNLPGLMGGLTFAVWMRGQYPAIPIILTSGAKSTLSNVKGVGDVPFVQKPYDFDEVTQLIEEALGRY